MSYEEKPLKRNKGAKPNYIDSGVRAVKPFSRCGRGGVGVSREQLFVKP